MTASAGARHTIRAPFTGGLHAEAGGESIDDNHDAIQALLVAVRAAHRRPPRRPRDDGDHLRARPPPSRRRVRGRARRTRARRLRPLLRRGRPARARASTPSTPTARRTPSASTGAASPTSSTICTSSPRPASSSTSRRRSEYATEPRNLSLLFVAQQSAVVQDVPDSAVETKRIARWQRHAAACHGGRPRRRGPARRRGAADRDAPRPRDGRELGAAGSTPRTWWSRSRPRPLRTIRFAPALPRVGADRDRPARARARGQGDDAVPRPVLERRRRVRPGDHGPAVPHRVGRHRLRPVDRRHPHDLHHRRVGRRGSARAATAPRIAASTARSRACIPRRRRCSSRAATKAWRNDRFTGGGYAAWRAGRVPRRRGASCAAPVGRLHFAGEHTEALAGYMESAVRSGHRVAAATRGPTWRVRLGPIGRASRGTD